MYVESSESADVQDRLNDHLARIGLNTERDVLCHVCDDRKVVADPATDLQQEQTSSDRNVKLNSYDRHDR